MAAGSEVSWLASQGTSPPRQTLQAVLSKCSLHRGSRRFRIRCPGLDDSVTAYDSFPEMRPAASGT